MTRKSAELMLAAIIIIRSAAILLSKLGLRSMGTFNLLGVRFTLAFLLLALLFHKRLAHLNTATLLRGMLLGGVFFAVMTAELTGLKTTPSSTIAFLENTAIVLVPLFESLVRRRAPGFIPIASACVTFAGVGLLTLRGGGLGFTAGELLGLLAAVFYAIVIMLTDRLSRQDDSFTLGILQVGFIGLFGMIASFVFESPRLPENSTEWAVILSLALVCSGIGFTLQPVAQRYTTSERTGMFCALSPVSAAVLSAIFMDERLGLTGVLGAALVLSGILISSLAKARAVAV